MCKVLMVPKITEETSSDVEQFVYGMCDKMSISNNHGWGYAAIDVENKISAEKWLNNNLAFTELEDTSPLDSKLTELEPVLKDFHKEAKLDKNQERYDKFGTPVEFSSMKAAMFHARFATTSKGINNTHPFIYDQDETNPVRALIHNGVLRDYDEKQLKVSTCDSEFMLVKYDEHNIRITPEDIQKVADDVYGYYVIGVMSTLDDGTPYMDIYSGNNGNLYCAYIDELQCPVFSTSKTDIESVCKDLNFNISSIFAFDEGSFIRINIDTGEIINIQYLVANTYNNYNQNYYDNGGRNTSNVKKWSGTNHSTTQQPESGTKTTSTSGDKTVETSASNQEKINNILKARTIFSDGIGVLTKYSDHEASRIIMDSVYAKGAH